MVAAAWRVRNDEPNRFRRIGGLRVGDPAGARAAQENEHAQRLAAPAAHVRLATCFSTRRVSFLSIDASSETRFSLMRLEIAETEKAANATPLWLCIAWPIERTPASEGISRTA